MTKIMIRDNSLHLQMSEEKRGEFFYRLKGFHFFNVDKNGIVTYDLNAYSEQTTVLYVDMIRRAVKLWIDNDTKSSDFTFVPLSKKECVDQIRRCAKLFDVEVSEDAEDIFINSYLVLERLEMEERQKKKEEFERMKRLQIAASTKKYGCSFCPELKWDRGTPFCQHCAERCEVDDLEVERLFEEWKETKRMVRPTAFPAKGCKYVTEAIDIALKNKTMEEFIYGVQRSVQN